VKKVIPGAHVEKKEERVLPAEISPY